GYEGQGPEHSSARLERFLTLCAGSNMRVANVTTPAQYFHLLRRQMEGAERKPLVVMTPKSLLRHPKAVSPLPDFWTGTFQPVIDDPSVNPAEARRIVFCSGKVFYDIAKARDDAGRKDVAVVRLEQLNPFPAKELAALIARYPAADLVWAQEEARNMGGWVFVR